MQWHFSLDSLVRTLFRALLGRTVFKLTPLRSPCCLCRLKDTKINLAEGIFLQRNTLLVRWRSFYKYRAHIKNFLVLFDCHFFIRFQALKRLRVAFSSLCVEKQGVLLIFNLFSSPKRFSCGVWRRRFFILVVCCVAFSFLCVEKQGVWLV